MLAYADVMLVLLLRRMLTFALQAMLQLLQREHEQRLRETTSKLQVAHEARSS
jgi:hypothetical protein